MRSCTTEAERSVRLQAAPTTQGLAAVRLTSLSSIPATGPAPVARQSRACAVLPSRRWTCCRHSAPGRYCYRGSRWGVAGEWGRCCTGASPTPATAPWTSTRTPPAGAKSTGSRPGFKQFWGQVELRGQVSIRSRRGSLPPSRVLITASKKGTLTSALTSGEWMKFGAVLISISFTVPSRQRRVSTPSTR